MENLNKRLIHQGYPGKSPFIYTYNISWDAQREEFHNALSRVTTTS